MTQMFDPPHSADESSNPWSDSTTTQPMPLSATPLSLPTTSIASVVVDTIEPGRRSRNDRRGAGIVLAVLLIAGAGVAGAKLASSDSTKSTTGSANSGTGASGSSTSGSSTAPVVVGNRPAGLSKALDVAKVVSIISPLVVKVSVDISGASGNGEGVGTANPRGKTSPWRV